MFNRLPTGHHGRRVVYHAQHGWQSWHADSTASILLFDTTIGWLWTADTAYPTLYRYDTAHWLWYNMGTTSPRSFYNSTTSGWEYYY